jgi:hypothetical protein
MLEEAFETPEEDGVVANTTTPSPPASAPSVVPKGDTPPNYSITEDEFAQMLEEAFARGQTPEEEEV